MLRFGLLEIIAVSFFNNLEEVKFYVNPCKRFGRVVKLVSTNKATTLYSYLYKRFLISRQELTL